MIYTYEHAEKCEIYDNLAENTVLHKLPTNSQRFKIIFYLDINTAI